MYKSRRRKKINNVKVRRTHEELTARYPDRVITPEYQAKVKDIMSKCYVGRPSKYRPEFNLKVLELARKGYTISMICKEFNSYRSTLLDWARKHPEFEESLNMAREFRQAWMEEKANEHIVETKDGERLNTQLWNFVMSHTCKDYMEQPQTVITKTEDSTIPDEVKQKLEALEARIRNLT